MSNRLTNFIPFYGTNFFPLLSNSKTFALKKETIYLPYKEIQQILSGLNTICQKLILIRPICESIKLEILILNTNTVL